jgi:type VI secretion system protein ImpC
MGATPNPPLAPLTLDQIVSDGRMLRPEPHPSQIKRAKELVGEFAEQVIAKTVSVDAGLVKAIEERIRQLDDLISDQLNAILHAKPFQDLEASWRGLHYLVMKTETGTRLKLRLLNLTRQELQNDLEKATEFDQSALFKKVYEEEYGTFGGHPYSCLVGDFAFGRHPNDIALIEKISEVAAAAHAPFIAAASPALFDMDSWVDLGVPRDLAKGFDTLDLMTFQNFRKGEDSRYVTLVLPRFLLRLPYGAKTRPVEGFGYEEKVSGKDHSNYLWGNAAFLLAERITDAFAKYGWTAAIRGVEGGGRVEGLPAHIYDTDEGDRALKCPTEVSITDRREKELNDLGFIALVHAKGENYAAFFGGATTNKPKTYNTPQANANARLSTMLPYMLAASRFAHYMKAIMRDKIGSFMTRENVQTYLNRWIADYVLLDDNASQPVKAKYPLREARVDVTDIPGKPGCYKAIAFLRPHFQLEELTVSIRMVAELPPPAA